MRDLTTPLMRLSLGVSALMLAGKLGAYLATGSAAILSDAAESVIHGLATGIAAFSLWYSRQPPDRQHPYGHGKIAYFSAGLEGALIFGAALFILWESVRALIVGPELHNLGWGLLITAALAAVNLALGVALVRVGKSTDTLILVANGHHVLTDMWTSVAVVIGVAIVWVTDLVWLDPLIAIGAALNILWSGGRLMWRAGRGLLDAADPEHTLAIQRALDAAVERGTIASHHQLRHRVADRTLWVEVHMLLPGDLDLAEAHRRVTAVESEIRAALEPRRAQITTHIEPAEAHDADHPGGHREMPDPLGEDEG